MATSEGVQQRQTISAIAASVSSGTTTSRDVHGKYPLFGSTGRIGSTNRTEFTGPSILVARVGANAGSVYAVDGSYGVTDNTIVIRLKQGQDVSFVTELLKQAQLNRLVYGSGQPLVTGSMLKRLSVPAMSGAEQARIAKVLDDAESLVATLKRLIAKKQAIKQGMMQQLLTGHTCLPGFTKAWSATTLGELGAFLKGRGVKRDDVRSVGVPCIRYGELYTDFSNYTAATRSFVTPAVAATALPIRTGDLLFAGSGETHEEIGLCVAYVGAAPAVAGGDIVVLRGSACNPIYLATLMNTPSIAHQKARSGQGDAVVHISSRALAAISLSIPERREQDAIAQVIMDADQELYALGSRLNKARAIKGGMMQQLLTGRVRLPVEVVS